MAEVEVAADVEVVGDCCCCCCKGRGKVGFICKLGALVVLVVLVVVLVVAVFDDVRM
ncbi:hypothetical protein ABG067_009439, partial [Albugo candida]